MPYRHSKNQVLRFEGCKTVFEHAQLICHTKTAADAFNFKT